MKCAFCSSVPHCSIVLPTIWMPNTSLAPPVGHAGLGELLGHDHLLERGQPAAAVLLRPGRAR